MPLKTLLPIDWPPPAPRDLPFELALKMGLSAGLGLWVAHVLGLDFPVYVLLAVATVADTWVARSWRLAGYRLIGTLIGVGLAILVVEQWSVTPLSAGVVMGALVLFCTAIGQHDSLRLAVLVFAVGITEFTGDIDHWAGGRLIATLVGAGITIIVSAVPFPHRTFRRNRDVSPHTRTSSVVGQE